MQLHSLMQAISMQPVMTMLSPNLADIAIAIVCVSAQCTDSKAATARYPLYRSHTCPLLQYMPSKAP